jgi:hypothetical protein
MRAQGEILSGAGTTESNRLLIGDRFRATAGGQFFVGLTFEVDLPSNNSRVVGKPEVIRFISNFRASGWPRISQVLKAEGWDLTWELWQRLHAVHHPQ